MVRILSEKRGDLKFAARGIVALIVILLLAKFYSPATALANSGFETANKVSEDLGLNDLISIPKIVSNKLRLDDKEALVADFKLNRDGEKIVTEGGDIRVIFSYKKLPEDSLRDVCTAFWKQGSQENINEEKLAKDKGFSCEIPGGSTTTAVLNGLANGKGKPAPSGEYTANIGIKEAGASGFGESKEASYKFFTESYVELLDKDIKGCGDEYSSFKCNVAACKKALMLGNFGEVREKDYVAGIINSQLDAEPGLKGCVKLQRQSSNWRLTFDASCTPEQVDRFNVLYARTRLFYFAWFYDSSVRRESDYAKLGDSLRLAKQDAVDWSLICTKGTTQVRSCGTTIGGCKKVKGASSFFAEQYKWTPAPPVFEQKKKEIEQVLNEQLTS